MFTNNEGTRWGFSTVGEFSDWGNPMGGSTKVITVQINDVNYVVDGLLVQGNTELVTLPIGINAFVSGNTYTVYLIN